jgi:putative addiction module component (TIGR02574 family)
MSTAPNLTLDEIEDEALRLPAESRAELVESLLASFSGADADVQREWLEEAERRRRELVEGRVEGVPAEEAFARARASLR